MKTLKRVLATYIIDASHHIVFTNKGVFYYQLSDGYNGDKEILLDDMLKELVASDFSFENYDNLTIHSFDIVVIAKEVKELKNSTNQFDKELYNAFKVVYSAKNFEEKYQNVMRRYYS